MSLTETAHTSRLLIKYGSIGLAGFLIFWSLATAAIAAYRAAHPPYTPPNIRYGLLPKIVFPKKKFDPKSFSLELANDSWPSFSDQARVYEIYRPNNSFLALEQDTKTAANLGFKDKPELLSEGVYQFQNSQTNKTLVMNVLDGSFKLTYPYTQDQLLLNPEKMPSKEEAIAYAKNFLQTADKYSQDIDEGEKKVSFWKIEIDGLKSVSSLAQSNVVRVDFFRKSIENGFKIVSSKPGQASISVLVSGSGMEAKRIIEVDYKYCQIGRDSYGSYPIKSPKNAYEDLKAGNYWPLSDVTASNLTIRQVSLAYFEPVSLTNFLQPVYVFEGDGSFAAYIPAIENKYISN